MWASLQGPYAVILVFGSAADVVPPGRIEEADLVTLLPEMVGYLQLAQLARSANARIRSARDLEARWNALGPEGQAEARVEWDRVTVALKVVRDRVTAGPRGFVREFKSAYKGEETAPIADPQSLAKMLGELHAATNAFREKLDAVDTAQQQTAAAGAAAPVAGETTAEGPAALDSAAPPER